MQFINNAFYVFRVKVLFKMRVHKLQKMQILLEEIFVLNLSYAFAIATMICRIIDEFVRVVYYFHLIIPHDVRYKCPLLS